MRMSDQKAIPNPNTMSANPTRPQTSRARHTRQMCWSGRSHLTHRRRGRRHAQFEQSGGAGG